MLIVNTPELPGNLYEVEEILGIVTGEVVAGINVGKDFLAGIRNVVGGRSTAYEEELIRARDEATSEMEKRAEGLGANAIVGVTYDYETVGADNAMFVVVATGTAIRVK